MKLVRCRKKTAGWEAGCGRVVSMKVGRRQFLSHRDSLKTSMCTGSVFMAGEMHAVVFLPELLLKAVVRQGGLGMVRRGVCGLRLPTETRRSMTDGIKSRRGTVRWRSVAGLIPECGVSQLTRPCWGGWL